MKTILLIESFYGGSHKQLMDLLHEEFRSSSELCTLPAKKWHWRARTSALYFAQVIPTDHDFSVLFTSSVLNLAELVALRSDIARLRKVLYFHENQLLYPVERRQERDFQYGYNQILSCLVADEVIFNSRFNQESFLNSLSSYFSLAPKPRPRDLASQIRPKCRVLYFPLSDPHPTAMQKDHTVWNDSETGEASTEESEPLRIVWPHRWEHDKNPTEFFDVLCRLQKEHRFRLSVIGESYSEIPEIFKQAQEKLKDYIVHWGYRESRDEYLEILSNSDVVVSTAEQEFFGVAMLEAVQYGCYPLCPNRLVYPEIYPEEYLYNTSNQLFKKLERFCTHPHLVRNHVLQINTTKFHWSKLKSLYRDMLKAN